MRFTRAGATSALVLVLGLIPGFHVQPAAAKDSCKVSCTAERKGCKAAFKAAFQIDKSECTGTRKAKRQSVKAARQVFRAARKRVASRQMVEKA